MPPGTTPPYMIVYSASSVPILQLALSGEGLSEQQLFDYAANGIRTQLSTVEGAAIPWPYGGKQRQVMIDLQPTLLQAKGLSPADVVNAVSNENLVLPSGTSKIGQFEYDIGLNGSPRTIAELNDLPVKADHNTTIYVHDVGNVRDGFSPQTNIVRRDGQRSALLTIMKIGTASTLDIVHEVRAMLPQIAATLPPALKMEPISDQSLFVRAAINGVVREAIIAACLTAVMILLFLGSWRSTLIIAVSIPLSILTSICVLSALGETINIMTLGGLALAVGILVDDATVTIENIDRNFDQGKDLHTGTFRRRRADCRAGAGLHTLHLHRISADVLPHRRSALFVYPPGRGGGLCNARVLFSFADAGADARDVSAQRAVYIRNIPLSLLPGIWPARIEAGLRARV